MKPNPYSADNPAKGIVALVVEEFAAQIEPLVAARLTASLGENWADLVGASAPPKRRTNPSDPHVLLIALEKHWHRQGKGLSQEEARWAEQLRLYRNSASHGGTLSAADALSCADAAQRLLEALGLTTNPTITRLRADAVALVRTEARQSLPDVDEYLTTVRKQFEFVDLAGVSPLVAGRVLRLRLSDIYVPLDLVRQEPHEAASNSQAGLR